MKPDAPAKAGPAPPAEADGNCARSGRGSQELVVVRELTASGTRTRTGRAVKREGTTGAVSHRQAVLLGARPRASTSPEPGRPNPPASTRSPVLMGRTGREMPKPQPPDPRPSPGTPAGGRVRPAQSPTLPRPHPRSAYTKPTPCGILLPFFVSHWPSIDDIWIVLATPGTGLGRMTRI